MLTPSMEGGGRSSGILSMHTKIRDILSEEGLAFYFKIDYKLSVRIRQSYQSKRHIYMFPT